MARFYGTRKSLPCSREPATGQYPKPDESNPRLKKQDDKIILDDRPIETIVDTYKMNNRNSPTLYDNQSCVTRHITCCTESMCLSLMQYKHTEFCFRIVKRITPFAISFQSD